MLNRLRDFVKRLELPQDGGVVYRIIDDEFNAVEVTAAQYTNWRMQNDVTKRAIVGQDVIDDVMVRTTFSIMPEHRGYKPFGTSAYEMSVYDPLTQYTQRYDTWGEAERGHRGTLERIRRDHATARAAERRVESLAGTAGEVRLAISADLPALFRVTAHSENEIAVQTPLLRSDGTPVELAISPSGGGFVLAGSLGALPSDSTSLTAGRVNRMCETLDVSEESGTLVYKAEDASQLGLGIIKLAQAIACLSIVSSDGN